MPSETPWIFSWVILPLLIFMARVVDVTLGTARLIFVSRGYKRLAPLIGFVEVLIWILVIGQIMQNLSNPVCYIAYAAGFATGNYVGMLWVERLSIGQVSVRVITQKDDTALAHALRQQNHGCTIVDGQGQHGPVKIIFTIIARRHLNQVIQTIQQHNPNAFYSIEDAGDVKAGIFPITEASRVHGLLAWLRPSRKGK